jgi:hypothetical protein
MSVKRVSFYPQLTFSLKLTHRNRQRTNGDLHTPDGDKKVFDSPTPTLPTPPPSINEPVEAFECQAEGEHILENEEARERFDGHAACTRQYLKHDIISETYDAHQQCIVHWQQHHTPYP